MEPIVSVVTPFYKRISYLKECISSLHNQTYVAWQHIIVNDGEVVDEDITDYVSGHSSREKISVINRNRLPKGAPTCRNIGLQAAIGKYVIFLDSDDLLDPHCLAHRVTVMEENVDLDFAVFPMLLFKEKPDDGEYLWNIATAEGDLERFLESDAVWQTTGPIWRKSALEKIGGFTEGLLCWQDVDIHLRALFARLKYKKFYESEPDCYYRKHSEGSISQGRINTPEKLQSRWHVFMNSYRSIATHGKDKKASCKNLKIMLQGILLSAIKARNFVFFIRTFFHRITLRVLLPANLVKIKGIFFVYLFRMDKVSKIAQHTEGVIKGLVPNSTIGKIKYQ